MRSLELEAIQAVVKGVMGIQSAIKPKHGCYHKCHKN